VRPRDRGARTIRITTSEVAREPACLTSLHFAPRVPRAPAADRTDEFLRSLPFRPIQLPAIPPTVYLPADSFAAAHKSAYIEASPPAMLSTTGPSPQHVMSSHIVASSCA